MLGLSKENSNSQTVKMSATLNAMEYVYADILTADQLMENDFIEYLDEDGLSTIVQIQNIDSVENGYIVVAKDDFGEMFEIQLADDSRVKLYVFQ
jgi:hypothetical protein